MIHIENPVQARAYGRALAWREDCTLTAPQQYSCGLMPTFYNRVTGETRANLTYIAHWQENHLVDQNGNAFFYDQAKAIETLRDTHLHTVRVTLVDGKRLSRSNEPRQYSYFHQQQVELGVTDSYIHPFDRWPKDHLIVEILKNSLVIVAEELTELVESLRSDELEIRNGLALANISRYNTDRIGA